MANSAHPRISHNVFTQNPSVGFNKKESEDRVEHVFNVRVRVSARTTASGREQPNDNVLLVTGCFQYRPTGAADPKLSLRHGQSGGGAEKSNRLLQLQTLIFMITIVIIINKKESEIATLSCLQSV
jgi:hypothetical protein